MAVAAGMLALPGAAAAENGWEAQFISQSAYLTLESGETGESSFVARNIGSGTWDPSFVRLGTTNPRDRQSVMYDSASWIYPWRPTPVEQASVAPGQDGTFTFVVRAPEVTTTTVTDEYFAPVADGQGWMENASGWPTNGVFLRYTIVPRQPPMARISSQDRVGRGQRLPVTAEASDNVRVARVAFSIDGRQLATDSTKPYGAALATNNLSLGGTGSRGAPTTAPGSRPPRTRPSRCSTPLRARPTARRPCATPASSAGSAGVRRRG